MSDHTDTLSQKVLTPDALRRLRADPTTSIEDRDEWHRRIGWLSCALDVISALPELSDNAKTKQGDLI